MATGKMCDYTLTGLDEILSEFLLKIKNHIKNDNYLELNVELNKSLDLFAKSHRILNNLVMGTQYQKHTLLAQYIFIAKFLNISKLPPRDANALLEQFKQFIETCNGQHLNNAFYDLCHMYASFIVDKPNLLNGIQVMENCIIKVAKSPSELTPAHADLLLLSLKAKYFRIALKFLDQDITNIVATAIDSAGRNITQTYSPILPKHDANYDSKYFLLYYYYGGMIYAAMKNIRRALYFFEICITVPATALSRIVLEAYKKYILLSLMEHGKLLPLPKCTPVINTRLLKTLTFPYHELVIEYESGSVDRVLKCIKKHADHYRRDTNMGLAKQVGNSMFHRNIYRLTQVFINLSLSEVAQRVGLPDADTAEKLIVRMIKNNEIYATINQKEGMVLFKDHPPESFKLPEDFKEIQQSTLDIIKSLKQLNVMEEEILLCPMFLKKLGDEDLPQAEDSTYTECFED